MNEAQKAIEHMNSHHASTVVMLAKHFGSIKSPTNAILTGLDENGMDIKCDEEKIRVPFLKKAENNSDGFRVAVMDLLGSLNISDDNSLISKDMLEFIDSFESVLISSFDNNNCICSYAPVVRDGNEFLILISEVAEHYRSISANKDKISIMFLEDESKCKTVFARKRVSFKAKAIFADDQRESLFAKFEHKFKSEAAVKMIKNMADFHIIKIEISKGRFVKGFGAAYNTDGLEVVQRAGSSNPHKKNPHQKA